MNITIDRADFVKYGACLAGMECLDGFAERIGGWSPTGTVTICWDWVAYLWARLTYPTFVTWALEEHLLPSWSLRAANLSGANLFRANLSGANLSRADLRYALGKDSAIGLATLAGEGAP